MSNESPCPENATPRCDCISRVNKTLEQYNTILDEVSMINFETGKVRQSLHIVTGKLVRAKGKAKVVLVSFCPFCGVRSTEPNAP